MNENPYATHLTAETPHPAEPKSAAESHELALALLAPSLRFITALFIVNAVGLTIYGLSALVTLRDSLLWIGHPMSPGHFAYLAANLFLAFAWPLIVVYGTVRVWQYRAKLELYIAGEIPCQLFAQAHLNVWQAFVIQTVSGLLNFLAGWALSYAYVQLSTAQ